MADYSRQSSLVLQDIAEGIRALVVAAAREYPGRFRDARLTRRGRFVAGCGARSRIAATPEVLGCMAAAAPALTARRRR